MRLSLPTLLLAGLPVFAAGAEPRTQRVALVVDDAESLGKPVFEKIAKAVAGRAVVSVYELNEGVVSNPIRKGELLAKLEKGDLIVPVGDGAAEFVTAELEDVPVYFVGVATLDGARLASASVAGLFSYSVDDLLDAIKGLRLGAVGLVYTPGYEPVARWIRQGAAGRGMTLVDSKISTPKDLAPAVRGLLERSRAIWVLGDPLLVRGAGLEFLRERALSLGVPIIASDAQGVRDGALLGYEPEPGGLAAAAAEGVDSTLRGQADPAQRLRPAPRGGSLLLNGTLAQKWNFSPTADLRWRTLR